MKKYKPTYKAPTPYAKRHRFLHKRHTSKRKTPSTDIIIDNELDEDMELNACSMYDCTGLIPSAIKNSAEAEAYESIYPYIAPATEPKE